MRAREHARARYVTTGQGENLHSKATQLNGLLIASLNPDSGIAGEIEPLHLDVLADDPA